MPLPETINALVGICPVEKLDDTRNYRGLFLGDGLKIQIDMAHPPSWQAHTLVHELTHLACALTRGFTDDGDEREEDFAFYMGRFLSKVLIDNPGLLDPAADVQQVDVLGEVWRVAYIDDPCTDQPDVAAWLHTRSQTMWVKMAADEALCRVRVFQLTCEAVLQACGVEEFSAPFYWENSAMLYALLRANPQAHPRAVMSDGPSE